MVLTQPDRARRDVPKETLCCNHFQCCFNYVLCKGSEDFISTWIFWMLFIFTDLFPVYHYHMTGFAVTSLVETHMKLEDFFWFCENVNHVSVFSSAYFSVNIFLILMDLIIERTYSDMFKVPHLYTHSFAYVWKIWMWSVSSDKKYNFSCQLNWQVCDSTQ